MGAPLVPISLCSVVDKEESDVDHFINLPVIPPIMLLSTALQSFIEETITDGTLLALRCFVSNACFGSLTLPVHVIEAVPL
jgi:hypothetical protein